MTTPTGKIPPHFIVIVPGYMGSRLRDRKSGDLAWVNIPGLLKNPLRIRQSLENLFEKLAYPNDDLEPDGIIDQVVFVPPLFKQEQYGRLVEALQNMGYEYDPVTPRANIPAVYTFAYDWRQDNRKSALQLGEAIDRWRARHPGAKAWLIGHSNGGIVSRWYIEKEGGKDYTERLFLMASPWDGAPKALQVLLEGLQMMFLRIFSAYDISKLTRKLILTFPSYYQLIPYTNPFVRDLDNQSVNLFADPNWLENRHDQTLLLDGRRFNEELGTSLSVETLCFFGNKKPTTTAGLLRTAAGGQWLGIDWDRTEAGDGTVPVRSAVHPNAQQKLPFVVGHGDIYVNPAVLEILEWELVRKFQLGVLAEAVTSRLRIQFEPDKDVYSPAEAIHMWSTVADLEQDTPVSGARINSRLLWREALPGSLSQPPWNLPELTLEEIPGSPGRYEGSLSAPLVEGYYTLQAVVESGTEAPVILEELILVEKEPIPA